MDAGLVVDAQPVLLLAYETGGVTGSALWLLPLFCLAVTLAVSVRTGVEAIVLSILVVVALQVIDGVENDVADAVAPPLVLSVAVVVVAGALTSVNESELRRRGQRMAILHEASSAFAATNGRPPASAARWPTSRGCCRRPPGPRTAPAGWAARSSPCCSRGPTRRRRRRWPSGCGGASRGSGAGSARSR